MDREGQACCDSTGEKPPQPGLLLVFSAGVPMCVALPLQGGSIELGRGDARLSGHDPRMSRRHARVSFDGNHFVVEDLGSHNGSMADGEPVPVHLPHIVRHLLRLGDSLFLVCPDVQHFDVLGVKVSDGYVMGPAQQTLLVSIEQAARFGNPLHITGESGTGKEHIAHTFHRHGPLQTGRFVSVNCAAIPHGLAERLLFGARRGAYSGASEDTIGYIEAAAGGTLFLDELAELDLGTQAKLLRVIESKELIPLGAWRSKTVDFQICSATNKELRTQVASGLFREDLYFRLGRPSIALPPLRNRPEEIPFLVEQAVRRVSAELSIQTSFLERCLLRPWPGNVRELMVEARTAAQSAVARSCAQLQACHLSPSAGSAFANPEVTISREEPLAPRERSPTETAERVRISEVLRVHRGNVSASARELGMHRTQLTRLLDRYQIDPRRFS